MGKKKSARKVVVYIWNFESAATPKPRLQAYGHASMSVTDWKGREAYISWWPGDENRVNSWIPGAFTATSKAERSYEDDMRNENKQEADYKIHITGLDEAAIIDHWNEFTLSSGGKRTKEGPLLPWSAVDLNCSTVVFRALVAGGADVDAAPLWFNSFMTPNRVRDLANTIKHRLSKRHLRRS